MKQVATLKIVVAEEPEAVRLLRELQHDRPRYAQVTVQHHDSSHLMALFSEDRAWMMFLREPGDPGFSTRNPSFDDSLEKELPFMLSNGQLDEYPASWTYSADDVFSAIETFISTSLFPTEFHWHNDSGDDCTSPNQRAV